MQQHPGLVLMIVKTAQWPVTKPLEIISHSQNNSCSNVGIWEIMTLVLKNSFGYNWDCLSVNKCIEELDYEHALDQPNGKNFQVEKRIYSNQANHLCSLAVGFFHNLSVVINQPAIVTIDLIIKTSGPCSRMQ